MKKKIILLFKTFTLLFMSTFIYAPATSLPHQPAHIHFNTTAAQDAITAIQDSLARFNTTHNMQDLLAATQGPANFLREIILRFSTQPRTINHLHENPLLNITDVLALLTRTLEEADRRNRTQPHSARPNAKIVDKPGR